MKKLLIVVDFQNDFVDGSLGFSEAKNLEDIIYNKIIEYQNSGNDVIYTLDTHDDKYLNTVEGHYLPILHCIKDSYGHALYGKVKELINDNSVVFEKGTFGSLDLGIYLKSKDYSKIELCGLVSNICVLSNAVIAKSALPNAEIIIDAKATDSGNKDLHEKVLDIFEGIHIKVLNRK